MRTYALYGAGATLLAASASGAAAAAATAEISNAAGVAGACAAAHCGDEETVALLQHPQRGQDAIRAFNEQDWMSARVMLKDGAFVKHGSEVVLLGGNYVWKAHPYIGSGDEVEQDAMKISESLSGYEAPPAADGSPRAAVPVVRLSAMMEAVMPNGTYPYDINEDYVRRLEGAVQAFEKRGVYVILDAHSDAWSSTNGGEGFPWWMGAYMQETAQHGESYITTPEHPLEIVFCDPLAELLRGAGVPIPEVKTVDGDENPWYNFSVGSGMDPSHMNLGNVNMRLNNNDEAWGNATLLFTKQVQNSFRRFLLSHSNPKDRRHLFEPYVKYIKVLFSVWSKHENVIAVELLNEPPPQGLPHLLHAKDSRSNLWLFYAKVLAELERDLRDGDQAPVLLQDISGSLVGANQLFDALFSAPGKLLGKWEVAKMHEWAEKGKLGLSFHFYPGFATQVDLPAMIELAHKEAAKWGSVPIFLSEFWFPTAEAVAETMKQAVAAGLDAVTYWQWVNTDRMGNPGWYKYSAEINAIGEPVSEKGEINWQSWPLFLQSVLDKTFTGAQITGARGGRMDILGLLSGSGGGGDR